VGSSVSVAITDPSCGEEGSGGFAVSMSGEALTVSGSGTATREEGACYTYVTVSAAAEGAGTLRATSPSGRSDSYGLFGATATRLTIPEDSNAWSARAESPPIEVELGRFWSAPVRISDSRHRQLMYTEEALRFESSDPSVLGPSELDFVDDPNFYQALRVGSSTVTATYGALSADVTVTVVAAP